MPSTGLTCCRPRPPRLRQRLALSGPLRHLHPPPLRLQSARPAAASALPRLPTQPPGQALLSLSSELRPRHRHRWHWRRNRTPLVCGLIWYGLGWQAQCQTLAPALAPPPPQQQLHPHPLSQMRKTHCPHRCQAVRSHHHQQRALSTRRARTRCLTGQHHHQWQAPTGLEGPHLQWYRCQAARRHYHHHCQAAASRLDRGVRSRTAQ